MAEKDFVHADVCVWVDGWVFVCTFAYKNTCADELFGVCWKDIFVLKSMYARVIKRN